jgi:thioredoxin 1
MKYYLFLFGAILSLSLFSAPGIVNGSAKKNPPAKSKPITFIENAYSTGLKKAKAEHKYIFVDAYATWCGPCKQLKKTTFMDNQAADFFNKTFVNVSVDMEKGEGMELVSKWEVQEYPTLLILDNNGNVVLRSTGYLDAKQLTAFGKKALQKK